MPKDIQKKNAAFIIHIEIHTSEMIDFTSQNLLIPFKTENRRTTNPQISSTFFCQTKQQKEKTKQSNTIELNGIDQGRKKN